MKEKYRFMRGSISLPFLLSCLFGFVCLVCVCAHLRPIEMNTFLPKHVLPVHVCVYFWISFPFPVFRNIEFCSVTAVPLLFQVALFCLSDVYLVREETLIVRPFLSPVFAFSLSFSPELSNFLLSLPHIQSNQSCSWLEVGRSNASFFPPSDRKHRPHLLYILHHFRHPWGPGTMMMMSLSCCSFLKAEKPFFIQYSLLYFISYI